MEQYKSNGKGKNKIFNGNGWDGVYFEIYAIVQHYKDDKTTIREITMRDDYETKITIKPMMDIDLKTVKEETLELMVMLA